MKYLDDIKSFTEGIQMLDKTVQEYIDLINSDYNFKEIKDKIISSLDRYEIKYKKDEIVFKLNMFNNDNKWNNDDSVLLYAQYDLNNIMFNNLTAENIYNVGYMYDDKEVKIISKYYINRCTNAIARRVSLHFIFVFDIDPPDDIISDALSFLVNKYGMIKKSIYLSGGYKVFCYYKEVNI